MANRDRFGIDIINLSLGHPIYEPAATDPLVQAVERASRAGIIVVAAAGNLGKNPETGLPGYAGITSPGNAPSAITVGAVRTHDTVSAQRRSHPRLQLRRPDVVRRAGQAGPRRARAQHRRARREARARCIENYPQLQAADADYMRLSGTSMATAVTLRRRGADARSARRGAPVCAGADAERGQGDAAVHRVRTSATTTGIDYDPLRQGAGALNGKGAIELARPIDTSGAGGTFWLTPTPSPWTTIGGEPLVVEPGRSSGATAIIWGNTDRHQSDGVGGRASSGATRSRRWGRRHHLGQQHRLDRLRSRGRAAHLGQRRHRRDERRGRSSGGTAEPPRLPQCGRAWKTARESLTQSEVGRAPERWRGILQRRRC